MIQALVLWTEEPGYPHQAAKQAKHNLVLPLQRGWDHPCRDFTKVFCTREGINVRQGGRKGRRLWETETNPEMIGEGEQQAMRDVWLQHMEQADGVTAAKLRQTEVP